MTIKDLKERFSVFTYKDSYLLSEKEELGKLLAHKYVGQVWKYGTKFIVQGFEPTNSMKTLVYNLKQYEDSLPYALEFYYPVWKEGTFEDLVVTDYLKKKGFELSITDTLYYSLELKNIYGKKSNVIIYIDNLDCHDYDPNKPVDICYSSGDYSWVFVPCERNVEEIIKRIDSILGIVCYSEITNYLKILDSVNIDPKVLESLTLSKITNTYGIASTPFKEQLKQRLLQLAEEL
jgi:hypothetical protein